MALVFLKNSAAGSLLRNRYPATKKENVGVSSFHAGNVFFLQCCTNQPYHCVEGASIYL